MAIQSKVETQLETVRDQLQVLFEQSDQLVRYLKTKIKDRRISRYLWRAPLKLYQGGTFAKVIADGGVMPIGSNAVFNKLRGGYFYSALAFKITMEEEDTTASSEQSIVNIVNDTISNAMIELQCYDDITFHQDGTGKLTNAGSATNGTTTLTFAAVGDYLGINMLREGMAVDVWNSAGTTKRAGASAPIPVRIIAIDYDAKTVTFNQTITGIQSTDILALRGMDAYGPAALTTYSSTWPATGSDSGLGGDSFRHGFKYMNDSVSSDYYLGIQRSAIPQLIPTRVNAQNYPLDYDHFHQGIVKSIQRFDRNMWKNLFGIAHPAQRAALFNLGIAISSKLMTGTEFGNSLDMLPSNISYEDTFNMGGVTVYMSKRQDRSRIDYIAPEFIERLMVRDTDYFRTNDGKIMFEGRDPSTGQVVADQSFFLVQGYDYASTNPGVHVFIDSLNVPVGYE